MTLPDFPFDAVLFDLDGTLLATDRFWIPAARVGARRAFAELGIGRQIPSAEEWMSMVGLPLSEGFDAVFPELTQEQRTLVQDRCVEEEHFALESGAAALLPGVVETLEELQRRGVPMGIASNCSQHYLDAAMSKPEIGQFIQEGRCLESRGIHNKAEMIEDLLLTFKTRSAVMVGDRRGDRDAAHANGLPHVHLENGFAPAGERVDCEARIVDFLELIPRLHGRERWIEGVLLDLGIGPEPHGPSLLGITGRTCSGKSYFARDAARILRERGRGVRVVSMDEFELAQTPPPITDGAGAALGIPAAMYELERVVREVLEPSRDPQELLILEGSFLLHPRLRTLLDRVIYLDVPEELLVKRGAARELPIGRTSAFAAMRSAIWPAEAAFDEACPPAERSDRVLDASNCLGPS